jgi:hypothetical protein
MPCRNLLMDCAYAPPAPFAKKKNCANGKILEPDLIPNGLASQVAKTNLPICS